MPKSLVAILLSAITTAACSRGVSRIQTHPLPAANPTTFTFPLPLQDVYPRALEAFSPDHQVKQPVFGRSEPSSNLERFFSVECSTNAIVGAAVFSDPANTNDLYLHTFHTPFVRSSVYHGQHGGLPFIAAFHLHLSPAGSNTTVTITASDTQVINGTRFGFGSCGPGQAWSFQNVGPTTVEEYGILRYLGSYLGITNMPPIILPSQ